MATNDVYELAVRQRLRGQQIVNTYHFMANGGFVPTQAQAQALADDVKDFFISTQVSILTYESWSLRQVWGAGVEYHASKPIRTGGLLYEGNFTGTVVGTQSTGTPLPPHVAYVIQLKTGLAGRRNRGRLYMGGVRIEEVGADGNLLAGFVTGVNGLAATALAEYGQGGTNPDWDWVIWSFRYASGWKPADAHPHRLAFVGPISSQNEANGIRTGICSPIWRVQRRREIGVGS